MFEVKLFAVGLFVKPLLATSLERSDTRLRSSDLNLEQSFLQSDIIAIDVRIEVRIINVCLSNGQLTITLNLIKRNLHIVIISLLQLCCHILSISVCIFTILGIHINESAIAIYSNIVLLVDVVRICYKTLLICQDILCLLLVGCILSGLDICSKSLLAGSLTLLALLFKFLRVGVGCSRTSRFRSSRRRVCNLLTFINNLLKGVKVFIVPVYNRLYLLDALVVILHDSLVVAEVLVLLRIELLDLTGNSINYLIYCLAVLSVKNPVGLVACRQSHIRQFVHRPLSIALTFVESQLIVDITALDALHLVKCCLSLGSTDKTLGISVESIGVVVNQHSLCIEVGVVVRYNCLQFVKSSLPLLVRAIIVLDNLAKLLVLGHLFGCYLSSLFVDVV